MTVLLISLLAVGFAPIASAQTSAPTASSTVSNNVDPADQGWHVDIAPYLWFPAINGTVGARDYQSSVHVGASDVLSNFNFGLMGAAEFRYNRIVMPLDFMWVRLEDNKSIPLGENLGLAESIHTKLNEDLFTPKVGYRLVSTPKFKMDALIGIRYWHYGATLTLQPSELGNSRYAAINWVDAVQGARFQAMIAPKLWLTIAGDAGAGGSKLDYQVVGLLGYQLKRVTLQGGWRYLVVHKAPGENAYVDAAMTGVVLGAVIPIK
ncbi:MAG TPA: hypothetical protein VMH20_10255 [Verrucomicrobiae bacterium]|nr:hypothetical protein [Verrucomicrobiae bacterium]